MALFDREDSVRVLGPEPVQESQRRWWLAAVTHSHERVAVAPSGLNAPRTRLPRRSSERTSPSGFGPSFISVNPSSRSCSRSGWIVVLMVVMTSRVTVRLHSVPGANARSYVRRSPCASRFIPITEFAE